MPTIASIKATLPKATKATYRQGGLSSAGQTQLLQGLASYGQSHPAFAASFDPNTPAGKAANLNVKQPKQSPTYSGTTVQSPPFSPLDSTYFQNVDANAASTANKIAGYQHQQADADTNLQSTLAGYARQQPLDVLAAQIAANRTGGLLSTSLGQHLGNIDYGYTQNRAAAQATHDQAITNLADQIAAAQSDQGLYNAGQYQDAVTRASQLAQSNPAIGMSTIPPGNDRYVVRGVQAPAYVLTPPKGAPAGAKWAGSARPGANWRGIGGGWWVPTK
jgi:hypothetical protein